MVVVVMMTTVVVVAKFVIFVAAHSPLLRLDDRSSIQCRTAWPMAVLQKKQLNRGGALIVFDLRPTRADGDMQLVQQLLVVESLPNQDCY